MDLAQAQDAQKLSLGEYAPRITQRLKSWEVAHFAARMWRKDPTLWSAQPVPEITDRLGWLTLPKTMQEQSQNLAAFSREIQNAGMRHIVLLGMGGSSLAPDVFGRTFQSAEDRQSSAEAGSGFPRLLVLDSTHPDSVVAVEKRIDVRQTLFLVSSKSGTTTEPLSFFKYFWQLTGKAVKNPGDHFAAITDPGTPLVRLAEERKFRRVFTAKPDLGGRYSALSMFGLVPAALIGVDLNTLLGRAQAFTEACGPGITESENPALLLGAALGELALAGRDKVTFFASEALADFPAWAEQLIAESTGKKGKGIVPVAEEPPGSPASYGPDRFFVHLKLAGAPEDASEEKLAALENAGHPVCRIQFADRESLGQEFQRWEMAVAAAGAVLGIHPFNQPDVELAKDLARQEMKKAGGGAEASTGDVSAANAGQLKQAVAGLLGQARPGDYFAIQAYLHPTPDTFFELERIRTTVCSRLRIATTLGYGPRFLHSTGQLHKGGPNTGLFLQLVDEPAAAVPVPETDYTFAQLIRAQAAGDYHALAQRGRRVLRVNAGAEAVRGIQALAEALGG